MSTKNAIESASLDDLINWWNLEEPPSWAPRPGYAFFNKLARSLRLSGPAGIQFLKSRLKGTDKSRKKAIAMIELSHKDAADQEVLDYLVKVFHEDDPRWKVCALQGLIKSEQFVLNRNDVEQVLISENKWAAFAALDYLSYAYPSEAVQLFRNGLRNDSSIVRLEVCIEVGRRKIRALAEDVRLLLSDPDQLVRQTAQNTSLLLELAALSTSDT